MSQADLILQSARTLPGPFTVGELVVRAWQDNPQCFELKGIKPSLPDSNKIIVAMSGERGLVRKGFLERLPDGRYQVANVEGRTVEQEKLLDHLYDSHVWELHLEGQLGAATFADACRWWQINKEMQRSQIKQAVNKLALSLDWLPEGVSMVNRALHLRYASHLKLFGKKVAS